MPCETLHFLARPWLLDLCPAGRLHPRGRKFSGFAEFCLAKLGWFAVSQELFSGSWCFLCLIFHDFPLSFHHEIPVVCPGKWGSFTSTRELPKNKSELQWLQWLPAPTQAPSRTDQFSQLVDVVQQGRPLRSWCCKWWETQKSSVGFHHE